MCLLYIYIYIYFGKRNYLIVLNRAVVLWEAQNYGAIENSVVLIVKARAITAGETPQKSLILPPVHIL